MAKNLCNLVLIFRAFLWPKNPRNLRNLWLINDLRASKAIYICRDTFTDVMSALQIRLFMQNKANFRKTQMNVTKEITRGYANWTLGQRGKNKANTKPIQTQFKANTKPIQTQFKPKQTQFYNSPKVKNFHLILVFGWAIVLNSPFNVKNELVSHKILRLLEIFGPRKAALRSPTELR